MRNISRGKGNLVSKRIASTAPAFVAMLFASMMLTFACALPAMALTPATLDTEQGLSAAQDVDLSAAAVEPDQYVGDYNDEFYQGIGVTWLYDLSGMKTWTYNKTKNWKLKIVSVEGSGDVAYKTKNAKKGLFTFKGTKQGKAIVTCRETWVEYVEEYDYDEGDWVTKPQKMKATHTFTIRVVKPRSKSGKVVKYVSGGSYYASKDFTFKTGGVPKDANVEVVKDSNKKGSAYVSSVGKGKITLHVTGAGFHKIKLKACGRTFTCEASLRTVAMKRTGEIKMTGGLTTYEGHKSQLTLGVSGVKKPKNVKWWSTNTKVATVNKNGVVKAKSIGRCYVKAKFKGITSKVLVEVTTWGAWQAVQNAFYDANSNITYSQQWRMSDGYRDCSSFVSRCYYDPSQGRDLVIIGGWGYANWAATAAGQAQWLHDQGRTVANKAVSVKKLRPGDTIYTATGYAGTNYEWRAIDHAAMYVGNGMVAQTHSGVGKGDVGIGAYWGGDSVKFIGRPYPW